MKNKPYTYLYSTKTEDIGMMIDYICKTSDLNKRQTHDRLVKKEYKRLMKK